MGQQESMDDAVTLDQHTEKEYKKPEIVTINHFKTSNFWARPDKPYYELDMGINGEGTKILTFGFINNDKYNDLVTTNHM